MALTISRRSLHGTPHYARQTRCVLLNSTRRLDSVTSFAFSFFLFFSQDPLESTQSSCSTGQSEVKKDVRIAFPRFNPQRAAGSFPRERTDQQKRCFRHLRRREQEKEKVKEPASCEGFEAFRQINESGIMFLSPSRWDRWFSR